MFKTELEVRHLGGKYWELTAPLVFEYKGKTYTVPTGFVTDFASVPRVPLVYMLTGNTAQAPSVAHDFLYRWHFLSRKEADKVFLAAMRSKGIGKLHRRAMYYGVRSFGYWSYKEKPGVLDLRDETILFPEWKSCVETI